MNHIEFTVIHLRWAFISPKVQSLMARNIIPILHMLKYHYVEILEDSPKQDTALGKEVCLGYQSFCIPQRSVRSAFYEKPTLFTNSCV